MGNPNPMRWDCKLNGCFNLKKRPKIEMFAECFPDNIRMGDVDGIVEINGHVLMLEWKEYQRVSIGQQIMYRRMTKLSPCHVLVVVGNPETMQVEKYTRFHNGKMEEWIYGTIENLKELIRSWVQFASNERIPLPQPARATSAGFS